MASNLRVLLVDDSHTIRASTPPAIEAADSMIEVRAVGTVADGYDVARSWAPDVVLLDVMILGADRSPGGGLRLLRWLRRDMPRVVVVMLTGERDRRSERAAMALGAAAYVVKGDVGPASLARLIRAHAFPRAPSRDRGTNS